MRISVGAAVIAVCLWGVSAPLSSHAADENGFFTLKGAGATDCAAFNAAVLERGTAFVSFGGWIEGYLSAMNRYEAGVYDIAGWRGTEVLMAAIANFCAKKPGAAFHDVMVRLTEQMRSTALTEKSPSVRIESESGSVSVPLAVIRQVQGRLHERDHYRGEITGVWSGETRAAISAFQQAKGLKPTGLPDQITLSQLLY